MGCGVKPGWACLRLQQKINPPKPSPSSTTNTSCSGGAAKQGEGAGLAACCSEVSSRSQRLLLAISVLG